MAEPEAGSPVAPERDDGARGGARPRSAGVIESVNVGRIRTLAWRGETLRTAFVKEPVPGAVALERSGLVGDAQADRRVHGGPDKAVYLHPREHYPFWEEILGRSLAPGAMGENLTSRGFLEADLHVGDRLEAGGALLEVSQPRLPCVKLGAVHQREDLPRRFTEAAGPGVYFRVLRPGPVAPGDAVRLVARAAEPWSVHAVFLHLTGQAPPEPGVPERLAALAPLGSGARDAFRRRTGVSLTVGEATAEAVEAVGALLRDAGLPGEGFPGDTPVVLAAEEGGVVRGGVALELHGGAALLRSLVVADATRGRGVGKALTVAAVARARGSGARSVSLLTETAADFFAALGFQRVSRAELPRELADSAELRGVCPESAACFTRALVRRPPG